MSEHKYPFVVEKSHPSFSGHFPDNPIVPGVIILEHVFLNWKSKNTAAINVIDYTKFLNPLRPDINCYIEFLETKSPFKKEFVVKTNEELVICKGRFVHD